ncbi:hypothetical protein BKA93DRAFT_28399 [Sparassis latifolia]
MCRPWCDLLWCETCLPWCELCRWPFCGYKMTKTKHNTELSQKPCAYRTVAARFVQEGHHCFATCKYSSSSL